MKWAPGLAVAIAALVLLDAVAHGGSIGYEPRADGGAAWV